MKDRVSSSVPMRSKSMYTCVGGKRVGRSCSPHKVGQVGVGRRLCASNIKQTAKHRAQMEGVTQVLDGCTVRKKRTFCSAGASRADPCPLSSASRSAGRPGRRAPTGVATAPRPAAFSCNGGTRAAAAPPTAAPLGPDAWNDASEAARLPLRAPATLPSPPAAAAAPAVPPRLRAGRWEDADELVAAAAAASVLAARPPRNSASCIACCCST